jgi:ferredoxin
MAYVVTDKCIQCKHTNCVEICPVKCFHEGKNFVVIDPIECINCNLCVPECPEGAIYSEDELPEKYMPFLDINARLSKSWPLISERKKALPETEKWSAIENKLPHLIE